MKRKEAVIEKPRLKAYGIINKPSFILTHDVGLPPLFLPYGHSPLALGLLSVLEVLT